MSFGLIMINPPFLISWSKTLIFRIFIVEIIRVLGDLVLVLLSANLLHDFGQAPAPLRTSVSLSMKQKGWTECLPAEIISCAAHYSTNQPHVAI